MAGEERMDPTEDGRGKVFMPSAAGTSSSFCTASMEDGQVEEGTASADDTLVDGLLLLDYDAVEGIQNQ